MQETFLKKVVLSLILGAMFAGVIEFYKTFIEGANQALNGSHGQVHMHPVKTPPHP